MSLDPEIVSVNELIARRHEITERIASCGVDPIGIDIVAVTKTLPVEVIPVVLQAGFHAIGENYPQELAAKAKAMNSVDIAWHAIGQMQRNKVKLIAPYVSLWQTIDRQSLAATVAQHAPGADVLVQINLSDDDARGGCRLSDVDALVDSCRMVGLRVRGLMTVGLLTDDTSRGFRAVRAAVDRLGLAVCSMGMSDDLEIAVCEGATMIRIGSALFGKRH